MNNDLISREALKKTLEEIAKDKFDSLYGDGIRRAIREVNNAQTVEPFEPDYVGAERLKARQRGYEEGYHNGMKMGKTLNPKIKQGEWIGKEEYDDYPNKTVCECSECGKMICISHNDFPNFCENCGAKMQKGGAE